MTVIRNINDINIYKEAINDHLNFIDNVNTKCH